MTERKPIMKEFPKRSKGRNDRRVREAFHKSCNGIQIDIMDIGKVFRVGLAAIECGVDDETLAKQIRDYVDTIRRN